MASPPPLFLVFGVVRNCGDEGVTHAIFFVVTLLQAWNVPTGCLSSPWQARLAQNAVASRLSWILAALDRSIQMLSHHSAVVAWKSGAHVVLPWLISGSRQ